MMGNYITLFMGGLILYYSIIFIWSKFYDTKINYKNTWMYICIVVLTIFSIFNHTFVNAFIRMISVTILMCLSNWLIYRKSIGETVISTIYSHLLLSIADVLSALILLLVLNSDTSFIKNNFFDTFIINILVTTVFICICYIPVVKKIYFKIVKFKNTIKMKNLIYICLLLIMSFNFLVAIIFYNMKPIHVIVVNIALILIYSFIVYKAMNERNTSMLMKAENESLMENLNEYENMLDRQRVDNHENKNQLLIIKNMIKKKDKDVIKYIDTIVKDEKEDDEQLYTRVKAIPSGGLQGIIYQKMLTMKDEKITFSLDVSRDLRKINLDDLDMDNNYKLCKIIGVLLDNAIEESRKIKDNCIMISLYVDDDLLIIDISNRFNSEIDIKKIDSEGYTTKGNGHGYGLSLVKKIIEESDIFINERKIDKNVFKQVIKVDIKKS